MVCIKKTATRHKREAVTQQSAAEEWEAVTQQSAAEEWEAVTQRAGSRQHRNGGQLRWLMSCRAFWRQRQPDICIYVYILRESLASG